MATIVYTDELEKALTEITLEHHTADGEYINESNTNYKAIALVVLDSLHGVVNGRLLAEDDGEFVSGIIKHLIIEGAKRY